MKEASAIALHLECSLWIALLSLRLSTLLETHSSQAESRAALRPRMTIVNIYTLMESQIAERKRTGK